MGRGSRPPPSPSAPGAGPGGAVYAVQTWQGGVCTQVQTDDLPGAEGLHLGVPMDGGGEDGVRERGEVGEMGG